MEPEEGHGFASTSRQWRLEASWCDGSVDESRWRCMVNMAQGGGAIRGGAMVGVHVAGRYIAAWCYGGGEVATT